VQLQGHTLPMLFNTYSAASLALEKMQVDHGAQRYQDAQDRFHIVSMAVAVALAVALLLAWGGRMALMSSGGATARQRR
jgi:hypothetical protein